LYSSGGPLNTYASGGVAYQAVAAPAVYTAPVAVATPVVSAAPTVVATAAPATAIYASGTPALATFTSSSPVQATPVEAHAVLQPVIKKYHKDHVSTSRISEHS
jgi:hypothetical protein